MSVICRFIKTKNSASMATKPLTEIIFKSKLVQLIYCKRDHTYVLQSATQVYTTSCL